MHRHTIIACRKHYDSLESVNYKLRVIGVTTNKKDYMG